jgi:Flp pilus assembly protein TadD
MKKRLLAALLLISLSLLTLLLYKIESIRSFFGAGNRAQINLAAGVSSLQKNEVDVAITRFHSAVKINPRLAEARYYLGKAYVMKGLPMEAEAAEYEAAIRLKPDYIDAHQDLGSVYGKMKRFPEAEAQFNKVLKLDPKNATAYNNLGYLYMLQSRWGDAEGAFKKSMEESPEYFHPIHNLARIYLEQGRLREAQSLLEKSLAISPQNAGAHYYLAKIAERRKAKADAVSHWEKAVELGLNEEELAEARKRLEELKK